MIFFILNISPPPPLSSPSLWEGEDLEGTSPSVSPPPSGRGRIIGGGGFIARKLITQ